MPTGHYDKQHRRGIVQKNRKCNCEQCKICNQREAGKRFYYKHLGENKLRNSLPKYDWDRT